MTAAPTSTPPPQSLADPELYAVSALGTVPLSQLQHWAQAAGQRYVEVDLSNLRTRKAALQAIGQALGFPQWYGANLDALYDCLTNLPQGTAGFVLMLRGFNHAAPREGLNAEDRAELLDVFRDALAECAKGDVPMRVFYA